MRADDRQSFKSGPSLTAGSRGFPPAIMNVTPATFMRNRRNGEPEEILSCLIPHVIVVFTPQLEISVTALMAIYLFHFQVMGLCLQGQYTFLGNCLPTPPLSQNFSLSEK